MLRQVALASGIVAALMLPSETFARHGGGHHGGPSNREKIAPSSGRAFGRDLVFRWLYVL